MNKYLILGLGYIWVTSLTGFTTLDLLQERPARVVAPFLDAFIQPTSVGKQYPLSCKDITRYCHRAHQLLLHERVYIIETKDQAAHVRVPHCQWSNALEGNSYWVDASGIIAEQELPRQTLYQLPHTAEKGAACPELVLVQPHTTTHGITLSIGTVARIAQTGPHGHWIWVLQPGTKQCALEYIPYQAGKVRPAPDASLKKRIAFFVDMITTIARPTNHDQHIPYVWGGASGTYHINRPSVIERENECFYPPLHQSASGFDCSGLVWCCAQAAHLSWRWRNTGMTCVHTKPLKRGASIHNGDLIMWPGHVIIVTDVDRNLVTHAEGYAVFQAKGAIYTTHVDKLFQDVSSIKQLKKHIDEDIPLWLSSKNPKKITRARIVRIG